MKAKRRLSTKLTSGPTGEEIFVDLTSMGDPPGTTCYVLRESRGLFWFSRESWQRPSTP